MLNEAKQTCGALDKHYEPELCRLIKTAIRILRSKRIIFDGDMTYTIGVEQETGLPIVTAWACTIADEWVKTTILTYVKANFDAGKDAERLNEAFENSMSTLMNTTGYTEWGNPE